MARDDAKETKMTQEVNDLSDLLRTLDAPMDGRVVRSGYSNLSDYLQRSATRR